ncbi:MAG: HNH endonuclease [Myxococcota bacterium]
MSEVFMGQLRSRSIPRTGGHAFAREDGQIIVRGAVAQVIQRPTGYRRLWLPVRRWTYVHVAVCEAWHGPQPAPGHQVDHEDRDRTNNRPENLSWVTPHYNYSRRKLMRGPDHPFARFDAPTVRAIRKLAEEGTGHRRIARAYGVHHSTISNLVHRRTYTEIV